MRGDFFFFGYCCCSVYIFDVWVGVWIDEYFIDFIIGEYFAGFKFYVS